jgi:hypothetical protein
MTEELFLAGYCVWVASARVSLAGSKAKTIATAIASAKRLEYLLNFMTILHEKILNPHPEEQRYSDESSALRNKPLGDLFTSFFRMTSPKICKINSLKDGVRIP